MSITATAPRHILIHGLLMIFLGLVWGLFVQNTPYPRLALTAHIQFESNGVLFVVLAILLLTVKHRCGVKTMLMLLLSVLLTWGLLSSEVANAWWGTNQILPIAAKQAGAPAEGALAWQEQIVKIAHIAPSIAHIAPSIAHIAAIAMLIAGFLRSNPNAVPQMNPTGRG